MDTHWYRLTIDLDPAGNPIGTSYEVRSNERIVAIHVMPKPDGRRNPHDEVEVLAGDIESRYGVQLPLF